MQLTLSNVRASLALAALSAMMACGLIMLNAINADSAWLLEVARRVLAGEQLYHDIMETNPPLVVWLHELPVVIAQWADLPLIPVFIAMVALAVWLSLLAVMRVSHGQRWCVAVSACGFTLLAVQQWGQREHLLLILLVPYLVSLWPDHTPRVSAAIAAAVGVCLKPYFVPMLLVAWVIHAMQRGSWRCLWRADVLAVVAVGACYAMYLLVVNRAYVEQVVPLLLHRYAAFDQPAGALWSMVLLAISVPLLGAIAVWRRPPHRAIMVALLGQVLASALAVVWQHKGWVNHWYPLWFWLLAVGGYLLVVAREYEARMVRYGFMIMGMALVVAMVGLHGLRVQAVIMQRWPAHAKAQVAWLKQQSEQTVMAFSFDVQASFPSVVMAGKQMMGAYGHLWWLAETLYGKGHHTPLNAMAEQMIEQMVAQPPRLVIVTVAKEGYRLSDGRKVPFDMIGYFSQSEAFATFWQRYHLAQIIGDQQYYVLTQP